MYIYIYILPHVACPFVVQEKLYPQSQICRYLCVYKARLPQVACKSLFAGGHSGEKLSEKTANPDIAVG